MLDKHIKMDQFLNRFFGKNKYSSLGPLWSDADKDKHNDSTLK